MAKLGGGVVSVVVPLESVDTDKFRRQYGFRPDCLEAGRFYWRGTVSMQSTHVDFSESTHVGSEGVLTGYEYEYLVFTPVFSPETSEGVREVLRKHVMDDSYQSMLLKEHR